MSPNAEFRHPGVYLEETPANVKVIPGVETSTGAVAQKWHPSTLVGRGYTIIETKIESGGLALLLAKGEDRVLVRMSDVRDGSGVEGQLVVTFAAKVP
jgi:hypothetical protein